LRRRIVIGLFTLGKIVITAHAKNVLDPKEVLEFLARHVQGDWGDLCEEDKAENERGLIHQLRLLSVYEDSHRTKFWIITEADRSYTTILLPEDY